MDGHSANSLTPVSESTFDRVTSTSTPRRHAVGRFALFSAGLAALMGLNLNEAEAQQRKKKKKPAANRCKCRPGKPGKQGPPGPEGPRGPEGPPGTGGATPAEVGAMFFVAQGGPITVAADGTATCTANCNSAGFEFYSVGGDFSSDLCAVSTMIQTGANTVRVTGRCPAGTAATLRCRGVCGPTITGTP